MFIVSVRKISGGTDSMVSTGIIFMLALPVFLAGGAAKGDIMEILYVNRFINLMLFSSGILFVGIANTLQQEHKNYRELPDGESCPCRAFPYGRRVLPHIRRGSKLFADIFRNFPPGGCWDAY